MICPKCGSHLREVEYEGVHIHTCNSCGGEIIGPDQLRRVVEARDERFGSQLQNAVAGHSPVFGPPERGSHRAFKCPACPGTMELVNYGGDSGIVIDRCEECGTMFLDHEELERIQVIMEKWQDDAPEQIRAIAHELERARREAAESTSRAFSGSRFAFVNAVINRLLDAA